MRNERVYLTDILISIARIQRFVAGMTYEQFLKDEKTIDGVARNFEVIGEAVKNVSKELKATAPNIGWDDVVGMRNKLIHEYWGTDLDIMWKAVQRDLPPLKTEIENMLNRLI